MARLLRVVKLYSLIQFNKTKQAEGAKVDDEVAIEPSKVGNKLVEKTTVKLILVVIVIVLTSVVVDIVTTDNTGIGDMKTLLIYPRAYPNYVRS